MLKAAHVVQQGIGKEDVAAASHASVRAWQTFTCRDWEASLTVLAHPAKNTRRLRVCFV